MKNFNGTPSQTAVETSQVLLLRRLIWSYFFLLIFEGALRKWIVPFAANPILLIRDPVLIAMYVVAWRQGLFPRNAFITFGTVLAILIFTAGMIANEGNLFVSIYGLRADLLHLPLIFLIPRVFNVRDVERVGYYVLLIAIPMAILMAVQFRSPPGAWINAGSDENFKQITSALGRIRAPGTFSFILGPVYFFTVTMVFLLHSQYKSRYPWWLTGSALVGLLLAVAVSGSRSMAVSVGVVLITALASAAVFRPILALKWLGGLIFLAVVAVGLNSTPIFQEGLAVFGARVDNASGTEGGVEGFLARYVSEYISAGPALMDSPLLGFGLGVGTNVGAVLLSGKAQFLLAENEWARILLESGPVLGGTYILLRCALVIWLGQRCLQHLARKDPLPLLLFGSIFLGLLSGNFGQPTVLGFVAFFSGLTLAAMRPARAIVPETTVVRPRRNRRGLIRPKLSGNAPVRLSNS